MHHLIASGELPHLEKLWLRGYELNSATAAAMLACATQVKSLELGGAIQSEAFVPQLPPVTELRLWNLGGDTPAALGRSRAAATVEKLGLMSAVLERADGFRAFGAFPRLRTLDLYDPTLGAHEPDARELASALPSLRRLRLYMPYRSSTIRLVARALGPRLEELVVAGSMEDSRLIDELQAYVAGSVVWDRNPFYRPLL